MLVTPSSFFADGKIVHLPSLLQVLGDNFFHLLGVELGIGGLFATGFLDADDRHDVLQPGLAGDMDFHVGEAALFEFV